MGGLAPGKEGGLVHGGEGGSAPGEEGGLAPGGEGGLAPGGEGGLAHGAEGGSDPEEGGLDPAGEGSLAPGVEGGLAHGAEGGLAPGEEEGDSLFLQIVGLAQHWCSLEEEAADSSGCVWDQMAPSPPAAMVSLGRGRSKVRALLPSSQEGVWEVLLLACPAFFLHLVVHKAEEGLWALGPAPSPWGHLVGRTHHDVVGAVAVSCALVSSEVGVVCLQGDAKGAGLPEESLAQEGLSGEEVFHQRTRLPAGVDIDLWV